VCHVLFEWPLRGNFDSIPAGGLSQDEEVGKWHECKSKHDGSHIGIFVNFNSWKKYFNS